MHGGVGTLSEPSVAWAAAQTEPRAPALVVLGEHWHPVLDALSRHLVIDSDDLALIRITATPGEAVEMALSARPIGRNPMARG